MRVSFSALSLESLSSVTFMLANYSSRFTAPIFMASVMTIYDDSASDCEKMTFFGSYAEELLL